MAKVIVAGDACVVTSTLKLEEIKMVEKYRPDALIVKDEEKEPIFALGTGTPGINTYGVEFNSADKDGFAQMTLVMHCESDVKDFIADKIGGALMNLAKIEETLPAVVDEIKAERDAIFSHIEVL